MVRMAGEGRGGKEWTGMQIAGRLEADTHLRLEVLHDLEEVIVDLRFVGKFDLDLGKKKGRGAWQRAMHVLNYV